MKVGKYTSMGNCGLKGRARLNAGDSGWTEGPTVTISHSVRSAFHQRTGVRAHVCVFAGGSPGGWGTLLGPATLCPPSLPPPNFGTMTPAHASISGWQPCLPSRHSLPLLSPGSHSEAVPRLHWSCACYKPRAPGAPSFRCPNPLSTSCGQPHT